MVLEYFMYDEHIREDSIGTRPLLIDPTSMWNVTKIT